MIGLACMAWLTVVICYGGNWLIGQCMIERPLVVGLVAGMLMGDVKTGVIIGASLEAIFMGAVNIGGAISASQSPRRRWPLRLRLPVSTKAPRSRSPFRWVL